MLVHPSLCVCVCCLRSLFSQDFCFLPLAWGLIASKRSKEREKTQNFGFINLILYVKIGN